MMRLWKDSYAVASRLGGGAAVSVAVHTAIIAAWVVATLPPASMPEESLANHPYYIPPANPVVGGPSVQETVRYIDLSRLLADAGARVRIAGDDRPTPPPTVVGAGHAGAKDSTETVVLQAKTQDSVYTIVQVDSQATVDPNSAAPVFPISMLEKHVPGSVSAQYVVDTTGLADTASFRVLAATTPEFAAAVRAALPYMRFRPARLGDHRVRQRVQQQFTFRIATDTVNATSTAAAPSSHRPRRP